MLTEDIDSSLRATRLGAKIGYSSYLNSSEEAPATEKTLRKQRLRWAQGWTEVSLKHLVPLMFSPYTSFRQKLGFFTLLGCARNPAPLPDACGVATCITATPHQQTPQAIACRSNDCSRVHAWNASPGPASTTTSLRQEDTVPPIGPAHTTALPATHSCCTHARSNALELSLWPAMSLSRLCPACTRAAVQPATVAELVAGVVDHGRAPCRWREIFVYLTLHPLLLLLIYVNRNQDLTLELLFIASGSAIFSVGLFRSFAAWILARGEVRNSGATFVLYTFAQLGWLIYLNWIQVWTPALCPAVPQFPVTGLCRCRSPRAPDHCGVGATRPLRNHLVVHLPV